MKKVIKKILRITVWAAMATALVATLSFTSQELAGIECKEISIRYVGDPVIRLSAKELTRLVKMSDSRIIGKRLEEINTEKIEHEISKNKTILKADAYKTVVRDSAGLKGVVTLKVKQRTPVMRVFSSEGNYYMDEKGYKIPVSVNYAADVPVVTGNISDEDARNDVLPFVMFIQDNRFWRSQIRQIHINGAGEIILTTLVGDQLIEFGTTDNMEEKFRNLRAFYEQVMTKNNWNKYSRIILKFRNQVIAKKNK
jgi:cell division protein FtsQ